MNLLTFILPESSTFNMSYFKGSLRSFVALMKGFKILLFGLWTHVLIPPFPNLASVTSFYV
jgi:hypothetical protein